MVRKQTKRNQLEKIIEIDLRYEKLIHELDFSFEVKVIDSESKYICIEDIVTATKNRSWNVGGDLNRNEIQAVTSRQPAMRAVPGCRH